MDDKGRGYASSRLEDTLRDLPLIWLGLALLVGVGLGLLGGWVIWPVDWYDTDPSDLRARHKAAYIIGVADSLAVTGKTQIAKERIIELTDDEIDLQQVADLVESVAAEMEGAGDRAAALRIRRMAVAVNLPSAAPATPLPEEPEEPARSSASAVLVTLGLFLISVALVIGAVMRLLSRRATSGVPAPGVGPISRSGMRRPGTPSPAGRTSIGGASQAEWPNQARTGLRGARSFGDTLVSSAGLSGQDAFSQEPVLQDDLLDDEAEEIEIPRESPEDVSRGHPGPEDTVVGPRRRSFRDLPNGALGMFEAEYQHGDEDYDTAFTIETADREFLGECGLSVSSVLDAEGAQKVNAFQIWLFDKNDIRTVSQILVSRYVYENEALNAQLSAKGELVLAEVEHSVTLETNNLQTTAIIKDFAYLDDPSLPPDSAFERVDVEFVVERANAF